MSEHKRAYSRVYEKSVPDMLKTQMILYNDEKRLFPVVDPRIGVMFKEHNDYTQITITISKAKS
jgi:hypothetical protein